MAPRALTFRDPAGRLRAVPHGRLARFFTERVFGSDRAAMLTTQPPASAAGQAERRDRQAAAIRRKIARLAIRELLNDSRADHNTPRPSTRDHTPRSH